MRRLVPHLALVAMAVSFAATSQFPTSAAADDPISFLEFDSYRLYMAKDSNSYAVYSPDTKRWTNHTFPKHLSVKPLSSGARTGFLGSGAKVVSEGPIVGFELGDAVIEELVAIDNKGRFRTHKLAAPIKRPVKPFLLGGGLMYFNVDGKIYAFSGVTGTWDELEAPEIPEPQWKDGVGTQPAVATGLLANSDGIVVKLPFGKMTFTAAEGRWRLERKLAGEKEVSLPLPELESPAAKTSTSAK